MESEIERLAEFMKIYMVIFFIYIFSLILIELIFIYNIKRKIGRKVKIMYGGLKCRCGNEKLEFSVGYSGADWNCKEGEGSNYGHEVSLTCHECGCVYTICHCKNSWDVSPVLGAFLGFRQDGSEIYAEKV